MHTFWVGVGQVQSEPYQKNELGAQLSGTPFLYQPSQDCPESLSRLADRLPPLKIAFVRAIGKNVMETARDALDQGLAIPTLVGEVKTIISDAEAIGWNLDGVRLINSVGEREAIDTSISLVNSGEVLGLIKGQIHSDVFMGGIVRRDAGIRSDSRMIHVFAMLPPNGGRALLISDAAVNVNPSVETRVDSALQMAEMARKLGVVRPKIAVLSATESLSNAIPSSAEAEQIAQLARKVDKEADYAGPLSLDLAISPRSVISKGIAKDSLLGIVAGKADALVVPDIVSGNLLFKSLVYFAGGLAAGIVVGGKVPIILTSRSDPPQARLASIALAALTNSKY